jgi:hypothetical protein
MTTNLEGKIITLIWQGKAIQVTVVKDDGKILVVV